MKFIKKIMNLSKSRKFKDNILNSITYLLSSFGVIVLTVLLVFIFSKGLSGLNLRFITGDYTGETVIAKLDYSDDLMFDNFSDPEIKNTYFSQKWGISFSQKMTNENTLGVYMTHIDANSPIRKIVDGVTNEKTHIEEGQLIATITLLDSDGKAIYAFSKDGAENMANLFDMASGIKTSTLKTEGGGIRASLITTLYLIVLTLVIALPLGVGGAIYLNEYAPNNKITSAVRMMIDMTTGIPSIIFGLVGAMIFIPFMDGLIGSNGGSIASGALTLAIILIPIIIKTTEESLKIIPDGYRHASLALGASKTQTVFKVVLPNAINGILTATLLSIGRIIGESAALIYAVGTAINDSVSIGTKSTSLAVHIWSIMGGENPDYNRACSIAILILLMVFVLSISVKLISKKLNKFEVAK